MPSLKEIQERLNELGFDAGPADGVSGKRTSLAVAAFQSSEKLVADGIAGTKTLKALFSEKTKSLYAGGKELTALRAEPEVSVAKGRWPRQNGCSNFYGPPGNPDCTAGTVNLGAAMRLAWDKTETVKSFHCHKIVAPYMSAIFEQTVRHYGEQKWRELGLDLFGGCYNLRPMRGGKAFSMHSWGIAVDIDPERNQLK